MDERKQLIDHILHMDHRIFRSFHSGQSNAWLSVDLTMPQLKVLLIVFRAGSATAGELARGLGVTLSTVTGIVDRLCEQGLVTRGEDPEDRRVTRVATTDAGHELVERLHRSRRECMGRLLERLDLEELRTVERALDALFAAAVAEAEAAGDAVREAAVAPGAAPAR